MPLWKLMLYIAIVAVITTVIVAWVLIVGIKKAMAEELPFPVYIIEKQNIYLQNETVRDFNEYNRQQREIDREYRMSQALDKAPAPPQNVTVIPDPPKHKTYVPFQD